MSYASQQFLTADNSTDANYRLWGSAISAAISAMGWVASSDTGQINWTTVTSPASGSFNYEIWKPGDAGTVFYFKIEYGSSSGSPKGPRLRFSIGTSTDGAGTLTGLTTGTVECNSTTTTGQGVNSYDCYFSGDTDRLGILFWRNHAAAGIIQMVIVERTKNTDGTNSSEGVTLVTFNGSGGNTAAMGQQTIVFGVARAIRSYDESSGGGSYFGIVSGATGSSAFNNNIAMTPIFPYYGKFGNPMTCVGFVRSADVAEGCKFTTTLYGSTRTYLATGAMVTNSQVTMGKACMRFD
jgi:hypothetical protein